VIALRNPRSVAASLRQRNGFDERLGYLLWLTSYVEILEGVAGERFVTVDYDRLMSQPRVQLQRLAQALDAPVREAELLDYEREFLDGSLRHHQHRASDLEHDPACPPRVREVYHALAPLAELGADAQAPAELCESLARWSEELRRDTVARE